MRLSRHILMALFSGIAAITLTIGCAAYAATPNEIFTKNAASIVIVLTRDSLGNPTGLGSGVVVGPRQVATNWHVIKGSSSIVVRQSDVSFPARQIAARQDRDLVVLEVDELRSPPIPLSSQADLKVGDSLFAIGAPSGLELSMSQGIVSGLRKVDGGFLIQTTASISPGSSGGGLFNADGDLVGLTTLKVAGVNAENLNFAIPVVWLRDLLDMGNGPRGDVARSRGVQEDASRYPVLIAIIVMLCMPIIYLVSKHFFLRPGGRARSDLNSHSLEHFQVLGALNSDKNLATKNTEHQDQARGNQVYGQVNVALRERNSALGAGAMPSGAVPLSGSRVDDLDDEKEKVWRQAVVRNQADEVRSFKSVAPDRQNEKVRGTAVPRTHVTPTVETSMVSKLVAAAVILGGLILLLIVLSAYRVSS